MKRWIDSDQFVLSTCIALASLFRHVTLNPQIGSSIPGAFLQRSDSTLNLFQHQDIRSSAMSDLLALLPPETRNAIYEYVLLRPEVYPYEYGSSVHRRINTGGGSDETSSYWRHNLQNILGNGSTGAPNSSMGHTGMPQTLNARLNPPSTALLCTCKRFHLEATAMLYTGNTFAVFRPESC